MSKSFKPQMVSEILARRTKRQRGKKEIRDWVSGVGEGLRGS
ncbi:MAG: hypothetical protein ACKVOM_10710 [Ferruginibacter sp.]